MLLSMALLVLPWALAAVNAAAAWLWPGGPAIEEHKLFGVQPPSALPAPDAAGLWSGAFQLAFARSFGQSMPLLATAVGLKNQAYFSLLGQSGVPDVVVGKHLQLYERIYIVEYCGRNTAALMPAADLWAAHLAQLQSWYAAEGKTFLYVVTPSKPATIPQDLPDARACRSPQADRDGMLAAWDALLDRQGVRHVDAAAVMRQAPGAPEMFPRGGTHWNDVAAALATQAVVRAVNAAPGPWRLTDFSFTWQLTTPSGIARDITDLLNLPFPRLDYRVPAVALQPLAPAAACRPVNVAVVGDSFAYGMLWLLMRLPCPPTIDFYSYFKVAHAAFPGDIRGDVDPAQRDEELLHRAGIVILEENEVMAMRSAHGPALYRLVAARHEDAEAR